MKRPTNKADRDWQRILAAWSGSEPATLFELAAAYTRDHPHRFAGWIALADVQRDLARYTEAAAALRCAEPLASPAQRRDIWIQRGHLHKKKGNLKLAVTWYRRAAEDKPTTHAYVFLGAALAQLGEAADAKRCHRKAIQLHTECTDEAHYNLGLLLRSEGRYPQAIESFAEALQLDPKYELAREALLDCEQALAMRGRGGSA
ncbi:MAG: tetratricopeptide repeat protein [Planctomycetota bacterium]